MKKEKLGSITRDMTMDEALHHVVNRFPNRIALVSDNRGVSYGQLLAQVQSLAECFNQFGLREGDRVATLLWSGEEFVYTFFAVSELGAVIAPLPPRLRRHQMEAYLRELKPSLVVTSSEVEIPDGLPALRNLQQEMPELKAVIVTDEPSDRELSFSEMLAKPQDGPIDLKEEPAQ